MPLNLSEQEAVTYVARIGVGLCACGKPGIRTVIIGSPNSSRQVPLCQEHYAKAWSRSAELKRLDPESPQE
jgi:hypothetical protein